MSSFNVPSPLPSVALFGATGGTGLKFLNSVLAADPSARINVLARTPAKLTASFPQSAYPNLNITKGDIRDIEAVKSTLLIEGVLVDKIVCTVGMSLKFQGVKVSGADPHICEDAARTIISAISSIRTASPSSHEKYPTCIVVSTTGISSHGRDIPLAMIPLYHWMLPVPHADKGKTEQLIQGYDGDWTIVRPSFLVDGKSKGLEAVRVGVEVPSENRLVNKTIGYTISREDVGNWMFSELIREGGNPQWGHKVVTITY